MSRALLFAALLACIGACEASKPFGNALQTMGNSTQNGNQGRTCYRQSDCWSGEVCAQTNRMNQTVGQCVKAAGE